MRNNTQQPQGRACPECGEPYGQSDDEGVFDCGACGLWTVSYFWEVLNDMNYALV